MIPLVAVGLTLAPFIGAQIREGWPDLRAALAFGAIAREFQPEAPYVALMVLAGGFRGAGITSHGLQHSWMEAGWSIFQDPGLWLALGLATAGTVAALRRPGGWLPVLWVALPLAFSLRNVGLVYPHYFLAAVPAAAVLGGLALSMLRPRLLAGSLVVVYLGVRAIDYVQYQQAAAAAELGLFYGRPLGYMQQAAREAAELAGGRPLFAGERGIRADVVADLAGRSAHARPFDVLRTLTINPHGAVYLAAMEGEALPALERLSGPAIRTIRAADDAPLYGIYELSAEEATEALRSARFNTLDVSVGGLVRARAFEPPALQAGQRSPGLFAWDVLKDADWLQLRLFVRLVDQAGRPWSTVPDVLLTEVRGWQPGETVLLWPELHPRSDTPTGGYWIELGLYLPGQPPLAVTENGREIGRSIRVGPVRVAGAAPPRSSEPPRAVFGASEIALAAVALEGNHVALTWQASGKPSGSYTVFVHGVDSGGNVVAQHDGIPASASYPTHLWERGDEVRDEHVLAGTLDQVVELRVGLYTAATGQRLPAATADGQHLGDSLIIRLGP